MRRPLGLAALAAALPAAASAQRETLAPRSYIGCETFVCVQLTVGGTRTLGSISQSQYLYEYSLTALVTPQFGAADALPFARVAAVFIPTGQGGPNYEGCGGDRRYDGSSGPYPIGGTGPFVFAFQCFPSFGELFPLRRFSVLLDGVPSATINPTRSVALAALIPVTVPEPTTLALAGPGVLLLGAWARRRRLAGSE